MSAQPFGDVKIRTRDCPLCETPAAGAATLPYGRLPWSVVQCRTCELVYMPVVPLHEELVETLAWDKQHTVEAQRRRREQPWIEYLDAKTRWRLYLGKRTEPVDLVNRLGPASGMVIDLGCSDGGMLRRLDRRFQACGVEISAVLARKAEAAVQPTGGRIVQAEASAGLARFKDRSAAAIMMRSFLEHDADIRDVMLGVGRKLRADGIAVLKVPNYGSINRRVMGRRWCGFRFPDHVNYLTRTTISKFAVLAGMRAAFPLLLSLPTDDNIVALLRPRSGAAGEAPVERAAAGA